MQFPQYFLSLGIVTYGWHAVATPGPDADLLRTAEAANALSPVSEFSPGKIPGRRS